MNDEELAEHLWDEHGATTNPRSGFPGNFPHTHDDQPEHVHKSMSKHLVGHMEDIFHDRRDQEYGVM